MKYKINLHQKKFIIFFIICSLLVGGYYYQYKHLYSLVKPLIKLPPPHHQGSLSVEEAISQRKTYRDFSPELITLGELSQLLWAAQGITHGNFFRAAPSAGSTYPIELFVIARQISGLAPGIYHYKVMDHALEKQSNQILVQKLFKAAFKQPWVKNAKLIIVVTADFKRTENKYHKYATPYVWMEAGHSTQNMMLEGVPLRVGMVSVGGFDYRKVAHMMNLGNLQPLYLVCMGKIPSKTR